IHAWPGIGRGRNSTASSPRKARKASRIPFSSDIAANARSAATSPSRPAGAGAGTGAPAATADAAPATRSQVRGRMRWASESSSERERLAVHADHRREPVGDLAQGREALDRVEDPREQVLAPRRGGLDRLERLVDAGPVATRAERRE